MPDFLSRTPSSTSRVRRTLALVVATGLAGALAACGGSGNAGGDSAARAGGDSAAQTTAAAPAASDTGMAGMDHSTMNMGTTNRSAPRDSNQAFLRMMSDHHAGFLALVDSAQPRLAGATAKADAQKMRQAQDAEQRHMLSMLSQQYSDSMTPTVMPSNRAMIDSVARAPQGAEADRVFYRQVIAHHREAIQMTEPMLPHLTGEVKQMAQKTLTDQRREIQEFERKVAVQR